MEKIIKSYAIKKIVLKFLLASFCFSSCDTGFFYTEGEVFVYKEPVKEIPVEECVTDNESENESNETEQLEFQDSIIEEPINDKSENEEQNIEDEISEDEQKEDKKLTLIVYMAADNDLESYGIANLKQMERAECENLNVLVLFDRSENYDETNGNWTDTRLFEVVHDNSTSNYIASKRLDCPMLGISATEQTELDMGNFNTLRNLIDFAKTEYQAEKYALIFWGHGTGWRGSALNDEIYRAVAIDDKTGTYMTVAEEAKALKNQGLSVIGFDTCFGAVIENIYELKFSSLYTVASPGISPSMGWNYTQLLEALNNCDFSPKSIALAMSDSSAVKTTVIDNQKVPELMRKFENFACELSKTIISAETRENVFLKIINSKSFSYTQYPCDMYLDIYSLADLYDETLNENLSKASSELKKQINLTGDTTNSQNAMIGVFLIPKLSAKTTAVQHSINYIKAENNDSQCSFIKDSDWWVPTENGKSGSLLDKLFYTAY